MPETKAPAADDAIVANMNKVKAASAAGRSHASLLAEETPTPPLAETPPALPEGMTVTIPASDVLVKMRPAEDALATAPVGLSERGWSPEVTSRDPRLVAEELAAIAGEAGPAAKDEPIDPNDAAALEAAAREGGFLEVRMNNARVAAITRLNDRLAAGIGKASEGGAAARAALETAVEQAQAAVDQFRTDNPPKATPTTPTTPTTPPATAARTRTHE